MTNETQKIKAIYVQNGSCHGKGTDKYKWISGITKPVREQIAQIEKRFGRELAILVDSHTNFEGQIYKLAINYSSDVKRFAHRQITDSDYEIVEHI